MWKCRDRALPVFERTHVMGVLNVTPDSFSDGGNYLDPARAVERGLAMAQAGADIIDVGGESTRPGASSVSTQEELDRVQPVVRGLAAQGVTVSIDTTKARVAEVAIEEGACIINDVSALTYDPAMAELAKQSGAGIVLMHMQGTPRTMQHRPEYADVVGEVAAYLQSRCSAVAAGGIDPAQLCVDPGIGFGKTVDHNFALLAALPRMAGPAGYPVLVGVSRKSFIGHVLGVDVHERLAGSLGVMAFAILHGAQIVRVHDVKESCDVARLMDILHEEDQRHVGEHPAT